MAETSGFWTSNNTGDGVSSGYTADQFRQFLRRMFIRDPATECVQRGYGNELAITTGAGKVTVATGGALVNGWSYENTTPLDVSIATPTSGYRNDRLVLRADTVAQTVRVALVAGVANVAYSPAVTQNSSTWEVPLATVWVNSSGTIVVTDERKYCRYNAGVGDTADNVTTVTVNSALTIKDGGISTAKIADNAVTTAKIADLAVTTAKLADGAVTGPKIAALAVTSDKIADNTIQAVKIANGSINDQKLAANAVTNGKLADNAVTTDSIAALAVTGAKIAAKTITTAHIADGAVTAVKIADGAITAAKVTSVGVAAITPLPALGVSGTWLKVQTGTVVGASSVTYAEAFASTPVVVLGANGNYTYTANDRFGFALSAGFTGSWIAVGAP